MTKTQFAKHCNVSRPSVYKAISDGRLVTTQNGKLDVCNETNKGYLSTINVGQQEGGRRGGRPKKTETSGAAAPKKRAKPVTSSPALPEVTSSTDLNRMQASDLNRIKTAEAIRALRVKTDNDRGDLVSRDTVRRVFSKLYQIDVGQWGTLGANVAPDIAAAAGVDDDGTIIKISGIVDKEVYKILSQVKRLLSEYLTGQKEECKK